MIIMVKSTLRLQIFFNHLVEKKTITFLFFFLKKSYKMFRNVIIYYKINSVLHIHIYIKKISNSVLDTKHACI